VSGRNLANIPPPVVGKGPVDGLTLTQWWSTIQKYMLAPQDIRNANSDFASGVVADPVTGNVTLGTKAIPSGRSVAVPTLFNHIGDAGRAADTRFLYPISVSNRDSVQSTAVILTATSGASTSTISVVSHSVKFDFGTVSYNSGTITGLSTSTDYYVYASDADFAGGAVTYLATTNTDNLIASGIYYVGVVTTPVAATSGNVSAATLANPTSITTSSAHGWVTGNNVSFSGMTGGFSALNGLFYSITVTSTTTFTIAVDASAYAAYTGGGSATRVPSTGTGGGGGGAGGGGNPWR
jgi:hypothetical protein